ncbi:MAG: preprotein translocase subunit YajC [Novosphingobium sp.]
MTSHQQFKHIALSALLAGALPVAAHAQTIGYGGFEGGASGGASASAAGDASAASDSGEGSKRSGHRGRGGRNGSYIAPYIEAEQVVTRDFSPIDETVTYTSLAAGVDATIAGRNNAVSLSVRYERRIGYGNGRDGDTISGIARGYASVVPHAVQIDAGVLAAHTSVDGNNGSISSIGSIEGPGKVFAAYAGPTVSTHAGSAKVDAHYRIGYTKIDSNDEAVTTPDGVFGSDTFDKSVVHDAGVHIGTRPGAGFPVGIGAGAGFYQEDVSNLDQRVRDFHARADILVPVAQDLALVGGVGYEDVKISARDAVRDSNGIPVTQNGRFVTDKSQPRIDAFDAHGLIWDAGVVWRPSRRTQLEAHVGRRYGTTSYFGSFAYAPNDRSSLHISVYDNVAGFGGQLNRALAALPAEFTAIRDPISGNIGGCVASLKEGNCLAGAFGSLRSATFRARGVNANYSMNFGRTQAGIGLGYDRRKFIAAPGTVLAIANDVVDENFWAVAYLNGQISRKSSYSFDVHANWFRTGSAFDSDATAFGATLAYYHNLTSHLSARAALGVDGISRPEPFDDQWSASALAGLRYTF